MGKQKHELSPNAIAVLEMIAAGCSYEQILAAYPRLTYLDIFQSAAEALDFASTHEASTPSPQVVDIRKSYPRAYEKWTQEEHDRLRTLIDRGLTVAQISHRLQRQRSAIRSRIIKLELTERLSPEERSELIRISKLDPAWPDPSDDSVTETETGT
ncbi:MAG TPA: hypothetical protein VG269_18355 [Tepidisphaeraceae bacterium]|jgi:DNA-binding NarL/FixJ family response regulator|nr:hypothetical protein [Tepidisphaeraceae bacterium]